MSKYLRPILEGLVVGIILNLLAPGISTLSYFGLGALVFGYGIYCSYRTFTSLSSQTAEQSSSLNNKAQNG